MPKSPVLAHVLRLNAGRDPERLARKLALMRTSPFAFFRGAAPLFYGYRDLLAPFRESPAVWSTGDLHLENFGCYEGDNRLAYFDLNDFDEAALGPLAWDLLRLLASLQLGLEAAGHRPKLIHSLSRHLLDRYLEALAGGKPRWVERDTAEGLIRRLLRQAGRQSRTSLLRARCKWNSDHTRRKLRMIPGHTMPAGPKDREQVARAVGSVHIPGLPQRFFRIHDAAHRIAGTASLGLPRYIVLIEGEGLPEGQVLLDLKAAVPSALAAVSPYPQPRWLNEAERIVTVQAWMQAVPPALLTTARLGRAPCVVRELQPTADRLRLSAWQESRRDIERLLATLAHVVAWGHLRGAGREGAVGVDVLMRYATQRRWPDRLLAAAEEAAERVETDWRAYARDYDRDGIRGGSS